MNIQTHEELKAKIWDIANRLRGPYRPPQYRLVLLPMGRFASARLCREINSYQRVKSVT